MYRAILVAIATFTALLLSYSYLTGISKMDVTILHNMQRGVVAEPIEAGDIIAISPDGQRVESVLCKIDLARDKRAKTEINAGYYNVVDFSQDRFMDFVNNARIMVGMSAQSPTKTHEAQILPFVGEVNRVVGSIEGAMPTSCLCDVARAVIESRSTACVVEKSLVETTLSQIGAQSTIRRTVGISLRDRPIVFNDPEPIRALCPRINLAGRPPVGQVCSGKSGFSFDVVARAKIGLIREARLAE